MAVGRLATDRVIVRVAPDSISSSSDSVTRGHRYQHHTRRRVTELE